MHSSFTDPEYVSCQSLVDTAAIGRLMWEERWQIIRQSHKKKQIRPKIEFPPPIKHNPLIVQSIYDKN
jgi:hypothetical protein